MLEVDMDCSITDHGWFEFKGWLANAGGYTGWELDIHQTTCSGSAGIEAPFTSKDHLARCGFINVFEWNEPQCIIEPMPQVSTLPSISPTSDGPSFKPQVERTVIFIEKQTQFGQNVFIRGGLEAAWVSPKSKFVLKKKNNLF